MLEKQELKRYYIVVVSLDEITLPSKGGIQHVQAWELKSFLAKGNSINSHPR